MNAATQANVHQLEQALQDLWNQHNQIFPEIGAQTMEQPVTIDFYLSALPASKSAQQSPIDMSPNRRINMHVNWLAWSFLRRKRL
jgi:hypothetical protein